MSSIPPIPLVETDQFLPPAVSDLWERARLADEIAARLQEMTGFALGVRRQAMRGLVERGVRQNLVASHLNMSPTRVNQLIKQPNQVASSEGVLA